MGEPNQKPKTREEREKQQEAKEKQKKKKIIIGVVIAIVVIIAGFLLYFGLHASDSNSTDSSSTDTVSSVASSSNESASSTMVEKETDSSSQSTEQKETPSSSVKEEIEIQIEGQPQKDHGKEKPSKKVDLTKDVDTKGLEKVPDADKPSTSANNVLTLKGQELENQHNRIQVKNQDLEITRLNQGTEIVPIDQIDCHVEKEKNNQYNVTLQWNDGSYQFLTDDVGKNFIEQTLK